MIRVAPVAVGTAILFGAPGFAAADGSPPRGTAEATPEARPDPAAVAAGEEANLVVRRPRTGFVFSVAGGPGFQAGVGVAASTGTGGAASLRVGHEANRDTLLTLELAATIYTHRETDPVSMTAVSSVHNSSVACVGAQTWIRPSVWIRGGVGIAVFSRDGTTAATQTRSLGGLGAVVGAGLDLFRSRRVAFDLELVGVSAIYGDGMVVGGGLAVGASLD